MHKILLDKIREKNLDIKYTAMGGIASPLQASTRIHDGANGIQLFTGLVFKEPKLVRDIRNKYTI